MAVEKKWPMVPPQLFIADGTRDGIIQVASTAGFKVKQKVVIQAPTLPPFEVKVQRVVSSTIIMVGPTDPAVQGKQNMNTRVDVSAYTLALGSFIFAAEQDKSVLKVDDIIQSVYRQEPGTTIGVEVDDQWGNPISPTNPQPVNIWPTSGIQFTLTALMLPNLIAQYVATIGTYTEVTSDTVGDEEILRFYNGSTPVGELTLALTPNGWVLNTGVTEEDFLLLEDGDIFELEDGSGGILLE